MPFHFLLITTKSRQILVLYCNTGGQDSAGDKILVEARFSMPVQTSLKDHPALCTVGTRSFQGVKQLGHGADHPLPPLALRL